MSLLDKASLIVTPNSYKESKLYSVVPNTTLGDMDVVRATTATRVNSAGLIEEVPRNLLTYSEQFDNAAWSKLRSTITVNATTSPDGTQNADKIVENTANNSHGIDSPSVSVTSGISYTSSVFAKASERRYLFLALNYTSFTSGNGVCFDLQTGTIVATGTGSSSAGTITNFGNGWYRCTITLIATATSSSVALPAIYMGNAVSSNLPAYIGDGISGLFIWGAQTEQGSTATEYFPTTTRLNIPRIDYTNGSCPSLLVEPQRTNLTLYSEQFDNAYWIKDIDVTVNSNVSISPSGNLDADRVNFASNNKAIYKNITATGAHRFSIYLKGEGSNIGKQIQLLIGNVGGTVNVTLTSQWQRFTTDASTSTYVGVAKIGALQADSVLIWGSQLEVGAYPTSYIPTVASSVTRNADVISKTGISSLIGQTEGTIFVEANLSVNASERRIITVSNATESQRIMFWTDGTILYANFNNLSVTIGTFPIGIAKIALGYTISGGSTTYSIKLNNNTLITGTSATAPNPLNSINIGATTGLGLILNDRINSVQIYKTRLTNAEITSLTTI